MRLAARAVPVLRHDGLLGSMRQLRQDAVFADVADRGIRRGADIRMHVVLRVVEKVRRSRRGESARDQQKRNNRHLNFHGFILLQVFRRGKECARVSLSRGRDVRPAFLELTVKRALMLIAAFEFHARRRIFVLPMWRGVLRREDFARR